MDVQRHNGEDAEDASKNGQGISKCITVEA
jgi:hypothetical protein